MWLSWDHRFQKTPFSKCFCAHENEKTAFWNSSSWKSVFLKLRFRVGLQWIEGNLFNCRTSVFKFFRSRAGRALDVLVLFFLRLRLFRFLPKRLLFKVIFRNTVGLLKIYTAFRSASMLNVNQYTSTFHISIASDFSNYVHFTEQNVFGIFSLNKLWSKLYISSFKILLAPSLIGSDSSRLPSINKPN